MNSTVEDLQISITQFQVLFMKYRSGQGIISEREIESLALYFEQGEWKLIAYCRLRQENREFMLSRIVSVSKTEKTFAPNQFTLDEYFKHK